MVPAASRILPVTAAAVLVITGLTSFGLHAEHATQAVAPASSSTVDPAVLKTLQWRSIGPARGGRSIAVSGVKGRPREAYFGAVGGGLWKTTDGGDTWAPSPTGRSRGRPAAAAPAPNPNRTAASIGLAERAFAATTWPGAGM